MDCEACHLATDVAGINLCGQCGRVLRCRCCARFLPTAVMFCPGCGGACTAAFLPDGATTDGLRAGGMPFTEIARRMRDCAASTTLQAYKGSDLSAKDCAALVVASAQQGPIRAGRILDVLRWVVPAPMKDGARRAVRQGRGGPLGHRRCCHQALRAG